MPADQQEPKGVTTSANVKKAAETYRMNGERLASAARGESAS